MTTRPTHIGEALDGSPFLAPPAERLSGAFMSKRSRTTKRPKPKEVVTHEP
jgi:hypothetical protein